MYKEKFRHICCKMVPVKVDVTEKMEKVNSDL